MRRREFLALLASAATLPLLPSRSVALAPAPEKLLVTIQLRGGLDVTSFCDPKVNIPGQRIINNWAIASGVEQAGNIAYAPFAENAAFFNQHYRDMLVINGVDAQTNSHSVGVVNNWSGRNSVGFPTITALMAATYGAELPLAYLNFGGFGNTEGVIRSTRVDQINELKNIIFPNRTRDGSEIYRTDWERIRALQLQNLANAGSAANLPEGNRKQRQFYREAFQRSEDIQAFGALLPGDDDLQAARTVGDYESNLHQQVQSTLLAFKAGVTMAADLFQDGFDTHTNHDADHAPLLAVTTDAIDYLWRYAEELGLADRLMVLVGSDFGRTPVYNAGGGKDHWPIGSFVVMERAAPYTNRVVGETDEGHQTRQISPVTLQPDDTNGVILRPAHVHKALRKYLGLDLAEPVQPFSLDTTEDVPFFS